MNYQDQPSNCKLHILQFSLEDFWESLKPSSGNGGCYSNLLMPMVSNDRGSTIAYVHIMSGCPHPFDPVVNAKSS